MYKFPAGTAALRWRLVVPQASNPLYKQPVTTHSVETDFDMFGKSYNGGVHWSLGSGLGRTGPPPLPTQKSLEEEGEWVTERAHPSELCTTRAGTDVMWTPASQRAEGGERRRRRMRMKEKGKGGEVCGLFFLSFQRRVKPIVKKRFDFLLSFPPLLIMSQKPSMNDCRKKVSGHVRKKKEKHCLYRAEQTLTYICIFFL